MRAQFWPGYEFWYQVSCLASYCCRMHIAVLFSLLEGKKNGAQGKIYLAVMLLCFWLNVQYGIFLESPNVVDKNGISTFVYEIKPAIVVFLFRQEYFCYIFSKVLVRICKENPNIKVQYEPVMLGFSLCSLEMRFLEFHF